MSASSGNWRACRCSSSTTAASNPFAPPPTRICTTSSPSATSVLPPSSPATSTSPSGIRPSPATGCSLRQPSTAYATTPTASRSTGPRTVRPDTGSESGEKRPCQHPENIASCPQRGRSQPGSRGLYMPIISNSMVAVSETFNGDVALLRLFTKPYSIFLNASPKNFSGRFVRDGG